METLNAIPLYTEVKNNLGFTHRIANPDSPEICPQKGIVIIEALKRNNLKQPRVAFSRVTDPVSGITFGIPLGNDQKTGEVIFQRIVLGDTLQFDLANPVDRKLWTVISRHQSMLGSPYQSGIPKYKIVDKESEATRILTTAKWRRRATQIAEDMKGVELYDMAVNLGLSTERNSVNTLLASIVEKAEKDPKGFLDIYDNANRNVITVFNRCLATGLIKSDPNNGYVWKDTHPLGGNDTQAIKSMINNVSLLMQMDFESKQRSTFYKNNASEDDMKPIKLSDNQGKAAEKMEPRESGFVSDELVNRKLAEFDANNKKMLAMMDALEAERQKTQVLNEKLANKIKEDTIDEETYEGVPVDKLQLLAFNAGWTMAKQCEDREQLIKEIRKRAKKK